MRIGLVDGLVLLGSAVSTFATAWGLVWGPDFLVLACAYPAWVGGEFVGRRLAFREHEQHWRVLIADAQDTVGALRRMVDRERRARNGWGDQK